jgi:predicted GNAT family acetyltransferase
VHRPERQRYELLVGGAHAGRIDYRPRGDALAFVHTEIDASLERRGLGTRLVEGALADVRASGLLVVPLCPFVAAYFARHPEVADLDARVVS